MRGQAMHEQRILGGNAHHVLIHLPIGEVFHAFLILGFESHAGPHVGSHQIRAARGFHRVGEFFVVILAEQSGAFRLDFVAGRGRDMHVEIQYLSRLQPGVAHVVGVADPCHGLAPDAAALLDVSVDVGQYLTRMVFVGQAVDHRHARVGREEFDDGLLEGADHHDVTHARDHLPGVFHRLAAPQLPNAGVLGDST